MLNAMGTTELGPTFNAEFAAAGLDKLCASWGASGFLFLDGVTDAQKADVAAFVAKHDPVASALAGTKAALKAAVDARAEALRLTLITPGSGQAMEYQEAYAEAVAVDGAVKANAGATFDPAAYPMLAASIGFDTDPGPGAGQGKPTVDIPGEARAVLAAYDAYQRAGAAIRNVRLKGKDAIAAAADVEAAQAAFGAIVWPTFG